MPDGERVTTGSEPRKFTEADVERAQEAIYRAFPVIDPRSDMRQFIRVILGSVVEPGHDEQTGPRFHIGWCSECKGLTYTGEDRITLCDCETPWQPDPRTVAAVVEELRIYAAEFWPEWKQAIETAALRVAERFSSEGTDG